MAELRQEIAVQKMLDHPNIVKVFETFEDTVRDRRSNLAPVSTSPLICRGPPNPTPNPTLTLTPTPTPTLTLTLPLTLTLTLPLTLTLTLCSSRVRPAYTYIYTHIYMPCQANRELHIIMEMCTGGALVSRMKSHRHGYGEKAAATLMEKSLSATMYYHAPWP